MEQNTFPVYRQLPGGRHYYRIAAYDLFEELQRIGGRWVLHTIHVNAYPERVRLLDMLDGGGPYAPLDPSEWDKVYAAALKM